LLVRERQLLAGADVHTPTTEWRELVASCRKLHARLLGHCGPSGEPPGTTAAPNSRRSRSMPSTSYMCWPW